MSIKNSWESFLKEINVSEYLFNFQKVLSLPSDWANERDEEIKEFFKDCGVISRDHQKYLTRKLKEHFSSNIYAL